MSKYDYVIVGLGNPGKQYEKNRHNVGFNFVDQFVNGAKFSNSKFNALTTEIEVSGRSCLVVKPQSYMNLSGTVVRQILNYFKLSTETLVVVYDDISFEVGDYRIKKNGSSGGHKGIQNIIENLNTQDFKRIKVGVGKNNNEILKDWVISDLSSTQWSIINELFKEIKLALNTIIEQGVESAMCKFNKKSNKVNN